MSVLLLGNGINLQERLAPDWSKLLRGIAKKYHFTPEKSLSMTRIRLALGFDREEAIIGPAVSALPGSGLAAYITEAIAALDDGYDLSAENPSI